MPNEVAPKTWRLNANATVSDRDRDTSALAIAKRRGLLDGPKTRHLSAKVPPALFEAAAKRAGSTSPAVVITAALAALAGKDDFVGWLAANIGVLADVPPEIWEQIEF